MATSTRGRPVGSRTKVGIPEGCPLTPRQLQLITALADGETVKQLAARTGRSHSTMRSHASYAYRRLGVQNLAHAVARCLEEGWIYDIPDRPALPPPPPPPPPVQRAPRNQDQLGTVTAAQRVALYAFDEYVHAKDTEEKFALRKIMERAWTDAGVCLHPEREDSGRDLVDRLTLLISNGWLKR